MLALITDQKNVDKLYREFRIILTKTFPVNRPEQRIGHQGGGVDATVWSTKAGDLWTCASGIDWNPFGLGDNPSMVVQVNFSFKSSRHKSIGVFAEDEDGQPVVLHRGNIGGGSKGVGKTLLLNNSISRREYVLEGAKEVEMLVVGQLRSPLFAAQLQQFVAEVHRVKQLPKQKGLGSLATSLFAIEPGAFKSEASGYSVLPPAEHRTCNRSHGLVVGALKTYLQRHFKSAGWHIFNDRHRDLILSHQGKVVALFEIKMVANTQDVATALGQLLLYGASVPAPLRRVMVLPELLTGEATKHLQKWGIECLYFSGPADEPRFTNLTTLLKSIV